MHLLGVPESTTQGLLNDQPADPDTLRIRLAELLDYLRQAALGANLGPAGILGRRTVEIRLSECSPKSLRQRTSSTAEGP